MSESNRDDNPYIEANAKKPKDEVTREDCYWDGRQENVLYDSYVILRDAGYSKEELKPLGEMIERTTIYEVENMEQIFEMMKNGEI